MNPEKILALAMENLEYMRKIRRDIHRYPGIGFDNQKTVKYIEAELSRLGISSKSIGKCGLLAEIGSGGKCFLLRADTDGLPIAEKTGLPFAAENGAFHGCGHDMHAAMLLGAAKIIKQFENELCGTVLFMFQSAEETLSGAKDMIESGVLENPKPHGAMMIHVLTGIPIKCGTVIVSAPGVSAPAADFFEIEISGKGCHGSSPSEGIDPIYAAASIVTALSEINSRELAMGDNAVLTIGCVKAGESANVIPDKAHLKGTLRCFDEDVRQKIKTRLCEISEGTAKVFRSSAQVKFTSGCPSLLNDKALSERMLGYTKELLGKDTALSAADLADAGGKITTSGSEDFAYVSHSVPSVMVALAAGEPHLGFEYPLHHPKADFDENALPYGCATLAYTAFCEVNNFQGAALHPVRGAALHPVRGAAPDTPAHFLERKWGKEL